MKITIGQLRSVIREWYKPKSENSLKNDASYKGKSVIVPDETKNVIDSYLDAMGLTPKSDT